MYNRFFVFLFLFLGHFLLAQIFDIDKEIKKVDKLVEYNQLSKAENEANNLYQLLHQKYKDKQYIKQKVELRLLQGIIEDSKFNQVHALPIFLEVLDVAEKHKLYKLECRTKIRIAFNYEKVNNYDLAYKYLSSAYQLCKTHNLNDLYSTVFIRYALLHRFISPPENSMAPDQEQRLLKLGFKGSKDSAVYYTEKAIEYALQYNKEYDLNEAYVTRAILHKKDILRSTEYYIKSLPYWKKTKNLEYVALMNLNIALNYLQRNDTKTALKYSDSSYAYYNKMSVYYKYNIPRIRAEIYEAIGNVDSAYHYLKIANTDKKKLYEAQELSNTKRLEEQYQNDKKEATIKNKNQQMVLIISLLAVIVFGTILLYRKNRQINKQNRIINRQLIDLSKTLEQKQMLLSELQHRVKNNLQHVISILEIQKESVDFNNIDELIRGNQNRIHSMALLHKKLNVKDNVNDIDVCRYITELAELVVESYDNHKKKILLNIKCDVEKLSIEKALPIGLIIVELVSNSMKHAFKKQNVGIINIEIKREKVSGKNLLYYMDTGEGFDFNKTSEKGLGQEIIKGLIDQLDGIVITKSDSGFELSIKF